MNIRNLFEWPAEQSEDWGQDIKERRDFYLYRFLPVCITLFIGSIFCHLSTKSSLLAVKTLQNDLLYLASAIVVAFLGGNVFLVSGNLLANHFSPKRND